MTKIFDNYPSVVENSVCLDKQCSKPNRRTERSTITMDITCIDELKILEEYIELLCTQEIRTPCGEKIETKRNLYCHAIRTRTAKLIGHHILIEVVEKNEKKLL